MVGVIPSIAARIFPRIIGCKKAMELILSGKTIGARDALEEGVHSTLPALTSFGMKKGTIRPFFREEFVP